ncbi:hypothetical protein IQ07DRAFT_603780 [Pyrenochaeta sp. DS3sAY3a]|nr:hypothetical protein IQ07DRAFT_603780 [Pyrenochaeta sp. DS3sAY3a]
MLPYAGLYLPETLHRRDESDSTHTEAGPTRLKYFQRKNERQKQELGVSEDTRTTQQTQQFSEGNVNVFSSLSTAFGFADFVSTSNKASLESASFAQLIRDVRQDMVEANRLYMSPAVSTFLDAWPDKRTWVEHILREVRQTLNDIGVDMDAIRATGDDETPVATKRKFEWLLGHQKRLTKKEQPLKTCQRDLAGAIHLMQTMYGLPGGLLQDPIYEAPVRPWLPTEDKDILRGPYSRQRCRQSQSTASQSSLALYEAERDRTRSSSVSSPLAELPGSTPEDLHKANYMEMYTPSSLRSSGANLSRHSTSGSPQQYKTPVLSFPGAGVGSEEQIEGTHVPQPEKVVDRNDSNGSTKTNLTVPRVARRYHAQTIDVQKHPKRHMSLPSELPCLTSQSSLIDDLKAWVIPNPESDQLHSDELESSSVWSSPTASVTSSPAITHVLTHNQGFGSNTDPDIPRSSTLLSGEQSDIRIEDWPKPPNRNVFTQDHHVANTSASTDSVSHTISQGSLVYRPKPPTSALSSNSTVPRKPLSQTAVVAGSTTDSTEATINSLMLLHANGQKSPLLCPVARNHDAELDQLQQRLLSQKYVYGKPPSPTLSSTRAEAPKSPKSLHSIPELSNQPVTQIEKEVETGQTNLGAPSGTPQRMSAQAKRQAAHRRRMEKAFGE